MKRLLNSILISSTSSLNSDRADFTCLGIAVYGRGCAAFDIDAGLEEFIALRENEAFSKVGQQLQPISVSHHARYAPTVVLNCPRSIPPRIFEGMAV